MIEVVKRCFGNYGNKPPIKTIEGKEIMGCTIMCKNYFLCTRCYWRWYFLKRKRRLDSTKFIRNFMKKENLKYGGKRRWKE